MKVSFLKNEVASTAAAGAVITLLIFLGVGVIVFSQVMNQANDIATKLNDTQAISFITDAKDMGFDAMQLLMISAFIIAAVVILGIVSRSLGGGGGV